MRSKGKRHAGTFSVVGCWEDVLEENLSGAMGCDPFRIGRLRYGLPEVSLRSTIRLLLRGWLCHRELQDNLNLKLHRNQTSPRLESVNEEGD